LLDGLLLHDHFLVLSDFASYSDTQRKVAAKYREPAAWWRSSVLNTANMGFFSSDRTIREYAEQIWNVPVRAT
jgi:starch phosphorylase